MSSNLSKEKKACLIEKIKLIEDNHVYLFVTLLQSILKNQYLQTQENEEEKKQKHENKLIDTIDKTLKFQAHINYLMRSTLSH